MFMWCACELHVGGSSLSPDFFSEAVSFTEAQVCHLARLDDHHILRFCLSLAQHWNC